MEKSVFLVAPFSFAFSFHKLPFYNYLGKMYEKDVMKYTCDISGFYTYIQMKELLKLIHSVHGKVEIVISAISNKSSKTCNWGTGWGTINVLRMNYKEEVIIN